MNKLKTLVQALRDALLLIRGRVCPSTDTANLAGELSRTEAALEARCVDLGDEAAAAEAMATEFVQKALKCRAARSNAERTADAIFKALR